MATEKIVRKTNDPRYWTLYKDSIHVPRARCPKCGEPWEGNSGEVNSQRCVMCICEACHEEFDKPVTRANYKKSRRACPHCLSLDIKKIVRVCFASTAEWDGYGYDTVDTDFDTSYQDYDVEETRKGNCNRCGAEDFNWNSAPRANAGLKPKPKSYGTLMCEARGVLTNWLDSVGGSEHEQICKLIEDIDDRFEYDKEEK